jgi:hypothetical protein
MPLFVCVRVQVCKCQPYSVQIDMAHFQEMLRLKRANDHVRIHSHTHTHALIHTRVDTSEETGPLRAEQACASMSPSTSLSPNPFDTCTTPLATQEATAQLSEGKRERALRERLYCGWLEWQARMEVMQEQERRRKERAANERRAAAVSQRMVRACGGVVGWAGLAVWVGASAST